MIDFSPAYNEGLIVHCRTEEESMTFREEAFREFGEAAKTGALMDEKGIKSLHRRKGDKAAYRLRMCGDVLICNTADIDWYRKEENFKSYKIIEYCNEIVDYGTISDDQIDILSLLEGGETHA